MSVDPNKFSATYSQKQTLAFVTYALRRYCYEVGAALAFVPTGCGEEDGAEEKLRDREEMIRDFVREVRGRGGGALATSMARNATGCGGGGIWFLAKC